MWETLREIIGSCAGVCREHRHAIWHVVSRIVAIVAIALAVEVLVCNYAYFSSAENDAIDLTPRIAGQLPQDDEGAYLFTRADRSVVFDRLNKQVENIELRFASDQPAQVVPIRIHFTDDAHSTYFDTTAYSVGIPDKNVTTNYPPSFIIGIQAAGDVQNIQLEVVGEDLTYPLKVEGVYLNSRAPFVFSVLRFCLLVVILGLVFLLRPRSALYKWQMREHPRRSKALVIAATAFEVYLLATFMFFGSNMVGIATESYNAGSWDGRSPANVFEVGGDNAQQYAELAESLAAGRVDLQVDPPAWLAQMDDPYDKGARDEMRKATGEDYLWDVAYHDGRYYVYFGVVPCLLFHLPFYLATGQSFPTALGVLVAVIAFVLGATALLWRFAMRHFRRVSIGVFLLLQMPVVACTGILYLLKFPTFYSLPIACALAFSVWGVYCWMAGRSSARPGGWYAGGSLCMALVLGCRPQLVLLSFVAFPLFWRRYIVEGRLRSPQGAREIACLLAPYIVVGAGIMWYNAVRFGSPLDFGANYNLTMNDMTQRGFSPARLAPALFAYLLQPPSVTGAFPYLQAAGFDTTFGGQTIREATFGGLFACLPLLWTLFFARPILKLRIRSRKTHTVAGAIVVMLAMGVVLACLDGEVAGILQRYFADFSFLFVASAVLLVFVANEGLDPWSRTWLLLQRVLVVLVAMSIGYSLLLCLVPETGWVSSAYPWAYQAIVDQLCFWG